MKRYLVLCAVLMLSVLSAMAQIEQPVKWSYAAKKINDKEAVVLLKATIQKGWHIYSQKQENGPIPTTFTFAKSGDYDPIGTPSEPKGIKHYEEVFDTDVVYFENQVVFQQKVKLNKGSTTVKGAVEFMACDDSKCLPPDEVAFSIPIK